LLQTTTQMHRTRYAQVCLLFVLSARFVAGKNLTSQVDFS